MRKQTFPNVDFRRITEFAISMHVRRENIIRCSIDMLLLIPDMKA